MIGGNQYIIQSVVNHPINGYALAVPTNDLDLALNWAVIAGEMIEALNDIIRIARCVSA